MPPKGSVHEKNFYVHETSFKAVTTFCFHKEVIVILFIAFGVHMAKFRTEKTASNHIRIAESRRGAGEPRQMQYN